MKQLIKTLQNAWCENPQEMVKTVIVSAALFAGLYATLWVGSALGLQ